MRIEINILKIAQPPHDPISSFNYFTYFKLKVFDIYWFVYFKLQVI